MITKCTLIALAQIKNGRKLVEIAQELLFPYLSGRRLENTSEGIRLQITKESGNASKLSCYLYIFQDAQINISDAQLLNVVY